MRARSPVLLSLSALVATACSGGAADPSADGGPCYADRTATFVVPYAPGGGYDVVARALAPALGDLLGGTVVVENQPGAGGLSAANALAGAEPDGLTFAVLPGVGLLGAALAEAQGVAFDPLDLTLVARVAPDERLLVTGPTSGLAEPEDLVTADDLRFASTGPGGADHVDATVLAGILDLDAELVTGYSGSGETALATTGGDTDLVVSSVAGLLAGVGAGDLVPVMVVGEARAADLPEVPALLELDLDGAQEELATAHSRLQEAGRTIAAPPGVPEGCVRELGAAVEAAVADEEVMALLSRSNERVSFLPGDELREVWSAVLEDSPVEYVDLLREAFTGQ